MISAQPQNSGFQPTSQSVGLTERPAVVELWS
jgi:hypothetical protein